ncbi:MAG TPA: alkaline phosphatase family protein [Terriglobales bacterium]|nr:alkaline phosphatase family protein [Terriglobales bacterium]
MPFIVISPFAKPHYVAHSNSDHTAILAFIEQRFLKPAGGPHLHLTARDQHAQFFSSMFDFTHSPSLNTTLIQASAPATDCTPSGSGTGLP